MRQKVAPVLAVTLMAALLVPALGSQAIAVPNPVALTPADYLAYGRVFPDPQGCGQNPPGFDPVAISPWAKGNVCVGQFLGYDEVVNGAKFLAGDKPPVPQAADVIGPMYGRYLEVINLREAYDNPNYRSAGLPQTVGIEDGQPKIFSRDRRDLYLFRVTDSESTVPLSERKHFAYSLSIHGIERAGLEGGIRAMEDLITWAACENGAGSVLIEQICAMEGGNFPRPIVETDTTRPAPSAGEVLENSVIYFIPPNPDGWHRGEVGTGGYFFQRYNGNGVDLNRDWPTKGYTYRPYSPGSEPETKAYGQVLRGIKDTIASGKFTGGIDLHGQLVANAYSYTLLGSGQRDYRRNFSTVDQALRAWEDQTARLAWSPYVTNGPANPGPDHAGVFPAADQWGTVIDTIGYQITGGVGDWFESPIGLDGVGIDNEMSLSHLAPNTVFDPINEQMHVDGNKGLIYSQLASMLTETDAMYQYDPKGKVGYIFNPKRITHEGETRVQNPGLPAQNDIDVYLPCQGQLCGDGTFVMSGTSPTLEFDVKGPNEGIFNGGITIEATFPNAQGVSHGTATRLAIDRFDEEGGGSWQQAAIHFGQGGQPDAYASAGQIVTVTDPVPGRWRARIVSPAGLGVRVKVNFNPVSSEEDPGQLPISASSMDFFDELNSYITDPEERIEPVTVRQVIEDPAGLGRFDSLVVVNEALPGSADTAGNPLQLSDEERTAYFTNLKAFAQGGGNLVLTDGALNGLDELGLVPEGAVTKGAGSPAPRINFSVSGRGNLCTPEETDPLAKAVCLPGTAGGTSRQMVEPTPIGYSPDTGADGAQEARTPFYAVNRTAWQEGCDASCTSGLLSNQTGLGQRTVGDGMVRVVGAMFPDPLYAPNATRDMRFGLASYALTFSAWQVFLNLVEYDRMNSEEPPLPEADLSITKIDDPDPVVVGETLTYTLEVANNGPDAATGVTVVDELPETVTFESASTGCSPTGSTVVCDLGDLASAQVTSIEITVRPQEPGQIENRATVSGGVADPDTSNNEATATTDAVCTITGTEGADTLQGTSERDVICGLGGDDTLKGLDGDDLLLGGDGNDRLWGNEGNDTLRGGAGDDDLKGAEGDDNLSGGTGYDQLNGGEGTDACSTDEDDGDMRECE